MFKSKFSKLIGFAGLVMVLAVFWGILFAQDIPPVPKPAKLVNDYAEILTPEQERHLEDLEVLLDRLNNYSRPDLLEIAHLNAAAVEEIIQGRKYRKEAPAWASLRKAGYGPVLTRLALSCVEENVTRQEVFDLIKHYQNEGIIPPDQKVERVIDRAWFVASSVDRGMESQEAHERFRKGDKIGPPGACPVNPDPPLRGEVYPSLGDETIGVAGRWSLGCGQAKDVAIRDSGDYPWSTSAK